MTVRITNNDEHITCYPVMSSKIQEIGFGVLHEDSLILLHNMAMNCEACDRVHEVYVDDDVLNWWRMKYDLWVNA